MSIRLVIDPPTSPDGEWEATLQADRGGLMYHYASPDLAILLADVSTDLTTLPEEFQS